MIPSIPSKYDLTLALVISSLSIHLILILVLRLYPAWCNASTTDKYASWSSTYLPTKAILVTCFKFLILLTIFFHSVKSGSLVSIFNSLHTILLKLDDSSIKGASYKTSNVVFSITQSGLTSQNKATFLKMFSSVIFSSVLKMIILGEIPIPLNSLTECWTGFDLCSLDAFK